MFQYIKGMRAETLRRRGQRLLVKGRFEQAEQVLRKTLSLSENAENRFNLALVLLSRLKLKEAEEYLQHTARDYPENELNRLALFEALILQEKWQSAIKEIELLCTAHPENQQFRVLSETAHDEVKREKYRQVKLLSHQAAELAASKQHKEALSKLLEALEYMPENLELLNNTGSVYWELKDYRKACSYYARALEKSPGNSMIQKNLSRAKVKLQRIAG